MSNPRPIPCPDCGNATDEEGACWNPDCEAGVQNIDAACAHVELLARRHQEAERLFEERRETA